MIRDWPNASAGPRPIGVWALALGYICMVGALVPGQLLPVPKGHEVFALSAFIGLCFGIVQLTLQTAERSLQLRTPTSTRHPRLFAVLLGGFALVPIVAAGLATSYVSHARPELPWVGIEWRVRAVPVYLSFAFWEWLCCMVFSAYTLGLCLAIRKMTNRRSSVPA